MGVPGHDQHASFPSTIWTLLKDAADGSSAVKRDALDQFVRKYEPAMMAYLARKWRVAPERAEDLLQGFFATKILQRDLIGHADPARGKFRTFLLTALDRFCISEIRKQRAECRGGGAQATLNEFDDVPADDCDPGIVFDVAWAQQVLQQALDHMRAECEASGRSDVWGIFEARVLGPTVAQDDPVPYEQVVKTYGLGSPAQASNLLVTAKRTFIRNLRAVVGEYAQSEEQIDAEILDLRAILAKARKTE